MNYDRYLAKTHEAAGKTGGKVESLAGGFYGVRYIEDGTNIYAALDLDTNTGWWAWTEDYEGERCCDGNSMELGWRPTPDLRQAAMAAVLRHRCI